MSAKVHANDLCCPPEVCARGNWMDAPDGPICHCGEPSCAQSGACVRCYEHGMRAYQESDLFHPLGKCRCAGEGRCDWCRATAEREAAEESHADEG